MADSNLRNQLEASEKWPTRSSSREQDEECVAEVVHQSEHVCTCQFHHSVFIPRFLCQNPHAPATDLVMILNQTAKDLPKSKASIPALSPSTSTAKEVLPMSLAVLLVATEVMPVLFQTGKQIRPAKTYCRRLLSQMLREVEVMEGPLAQWAIRSLPQMLLHNFDSGAV